MLKIVTDAVGLTSPSKKGEFTAKTGEKIIGFWKPSQDYGFMSNWYPLKKPLTHDEYEFANSEQLIMYMKWVIFKNADPQNAEIGKKILGTSDPKEVKKLGREILGFDQAIWDAEIRRVAYESQKIKFEQNPDLAEKLKETGDALLVEASPYDAIWGIGLEANEANREKIENKDWDGQNILGEALMRVRRDL